MFKKNIKFGSLRYTHNCIMIFKCHENSLRYSLGNKCIIEYHCNECVKY